MEIALALLASPAGQALVAAGISQVLTIAGGGDAAQAAQDFQDATYAYKAAVSEWEKAKAANPT